MIGDLALAGAPIIGHYHGNRLGHQLNTDLVTLLTNDRTAWTKVPGDRLAESLADMRDDEAASIAPGHDRSRGGGMSVSGASAPSRSRQLGDRILCFLGEG